MRAVRFAAGCVVFWVLVLASPAQATLPGVNGKIAFSSGGLGGGDIYTVNPDGSELTNVTNGAAPAARMPSWSPDATQIVFASEGDNPGWSDLFTVDAAGGSVTNITNTPELFEFQPAWSPDGAKIAFMTDEGNGLEVYTIAPDGTDRTNVSNNNYSMEADPAWSPDGTRIAFETEREDNGFAPAIWLMNANGSAQTRLTDGIEPSWSPDGARIVFTALGVSLRTMNVDGTGEAGMPGSGPGERSPVWSPDGQQVAFSALGSIYTRNVDGTGTAAVAAGAFPDWAPVPANAPPDCSSVTAAPSSLAPADRTLPLVALGGATDPDGDTVALEISSVTQDEPLSGAEDKTSPDAFSKQLTPDPDVAALLDNEPDEVYLRSERRNSGDGRTYRVGFSGSDGHGGTCEGTTTVSVPRHGATAVDSSPPSYDSFGS